MQSQSSGVVRSIVVPDVVFVEHGGVEIVGERDF